jgi:hypothetical protein
MDLTYYNPFLQIDEYKFQELCRDVLGKQREEGITTCRVYEVRGAAQYGADILANCDDGRSVDIGQCKRYSDFPAPKIAKASDEFLTHLDTHWKPGYAVRRFILIVACKLEKKDQHAEIQKQAERFSALGIRYEVWDHDTLRFKLAPHPDLVRYHFPRPVEPWVEVICGTTSSAYKIHDATGGRLTLNLLNEQVEKIASILSTEQAAKLESIRELSRRGRSTEAYDQVCALRSGDGWSLLDAKLKAKVLKVMAGLTLATHSDTSKARELVDEASTIDPAGDHSFARALIAYYEDGPVSALALIKEPKDTETFNLGVAFHLELNDAAEALALIESPPEVIRPNTETRRLRSLALLGAGRLQEAQSEIAAAVDEQPEWEGIRTVKAMVDYYGSLSPAGLPKHSLSWPEPMPWQFIKRDSESVAKLRAAEKHFGALASSGEKLDDQKLLFETWRLACLANDSEKQEEAVNYCKELLGENPAHPYALAWAITRNFDVDFAPSRAALERAVRRRLDDEGDERIDGALALLGIYLKQGVLREARKLLEKMRPELQRIGATSLYTFWLGQFAIHEGRFDEALAVAHGETNASVRRRIKAMALRAKYIQTGVWKPLSRHLEKCFRKTSAGDYLMELCLLKAERKHWGFVAERSDQLVESVATSDAVSLAAVSLWNARRPTKCLQVLDEHKDMFPGGALPAELARVRIHCRTRSGALAQAVTEAEDLVERDDSTQNIITLMDAQLQKADLRGLAASARKLLQRSDVDAASLIRAARFVHLEDAELAKKLWGRAKDNVLDDPVVLSEALSLSYVLGLEKEAWPLFERMTKYAEAGVKPFSYCHVKAMVPQMKQGIEHQRTVQDLYAKGMLPLHFFAAQAKYPLTDLLHGLPAMSRHDVDLLRQPKIFARHGGRALQRFNEESQTEWRLFVDVTALILAADLEILDEVEEVFRPINVSISLPKALVSQLEKLLSGQVNEIEKYRGVLSALEAGKFQPHPQDAGQSDGELDGLGEFADRVGVSWVRLAERARAESSYLVDHLPLTTRDGEMRPVAVPEALASNVINCRGVLDSLYAGGWITDVGYGQALAALGTEGNKVVENQPQPPPDSKLLLLNHTAGSLAGAQLLNQTCRHFRVFVDQQYLERIRAEVAEYDRHQELAGWLRRLKDRLSEGLGDGTYVGISMGDELPPKTDDPELAANYDFASVNDLIHFKARPGDVVWVDDRYTNSYSNMSGALIITVTDILASLRVRGKLTEADYYGKLTKLRAGNIRYLPLKKDEILFHLNRARVIQGRLIETEDLAVLRRYAAACLYDSNALQRPPVPDELPNKWGELHFVLETTGAVTDSIATVWEAEGENLDSVKARADWLVENLYVGKFGIRNLLPNSDPQSDGLYYVGLDLGELLAKGIGVGNPLTPEDEQSRRQQYFQWLDEKIIGPRIKADPAAVAAAAKVFTNLFAEHASQQYGSDSEKRLSQFAMQKLFLDLPEPIKDELKSDTNVMSWLGVTVGSFIKVGPHLYPPAKFWSAAEKTINGETATIKTEGSEEIFTLAKTRASNVDSLAVEVLNSEGASTGKIDTPLMGVLWRERLKRLEWLKRNRFWFDCEQEVFEREVDEIASLLDPRVRMERVNSWARESAEVFYRDKANKFNAIKQVNWTDLTGLSAGGLLRHYRLEPRYPEGTDFLGVLSSSTKRLLAEEGLESTLDRISCLPVKIDESVVAALKSLPEDSRDGLFERLALEWSSPVCKLHFLDLVMRCAPDAQRALSYAESVVEDLFGDARGAPEFKLFDAVLNVVNQEFGYWESASEWSAQIKLALVWAHASRLFNLLHAQFGSSESLTAWLLDPTRQFDQEIFSRDPACWNDCLHPRKLNRKVFLTHGVASLLASNEASALTALNIPDLVRRNVFNKGVDPEIPERELLRDPSLLTNITGSFFGGDRAETLGALLSAEGLDILASCNLEQFVRRALELLTQDGASQEWGAVRLIIGDMPLYGELRQEFLTLVEGLDFNRVLQVDAQLALFALNVIASQKAILNEPIKERCREWLIRLTENWAAKSKSTGDNEEEATQEEEAAVSAAYSLVDIALWLALEPGAPRSSSEGFRDLIYLMLSRWSDLGVIIEPLVAKLNLELPIKQLHGMPDLLLTLRAGRDVVN